MNPNVEDESEPTDPEGMKGTRQPSAAPASPGPPEVLASFTDREWHPVTAGANAAEEDRASAGRVRAGLGEELGNILNAETLVVLAGLGTSLGIRQTDGSKDAPTMAALWDDVATLAEFQAATPQLGADLVARQNLEHVLSDAQARNALAPTPELGAFIVAAERVVLNRCSFVVQDTDVSLRLS